MGDRTTTIEDDIRKEAAALGFAAVGFATLGPSRTMDRYRAWLRRGLAGGMEYLERHQAMRADARGLMPGARSIIVMAARYEASGPPSGFSLYARGRDYHEVLRDKLEGLLPLLRRHGAAAGAGDSVRICVDAAPLLEREWALRAGLGWRGRNGCVVNAGLGCCLFLAEVLVNLDLTPSDPVADQCGDCRRCLDACPTGALQADGTVDARRCLSYLTIEHRGDLSPATPLHGALFGCDRCTTVCPWNRFGADRVMPEFRADRPMPSPADILAMTPATFRERFKETAVLRTGLERLQRNAAAAMKDEAGGG